MDTAVLFDLDCTLVDRIISIRQYANRFAEDFRNRLLTTSVERMAEILTDADEWGYRPAAKRSDDIVANRMWKERPSRDEVIAHWNNNFPSF